MANIFQRIRNFKTRYRIKIVEPKDQDAEYYVQYTNLPFPYRREEWVTIVHTYERQKPFDFKTLKRAQEYIDKEIAQQNPRYVSHPQE